MRESAQSEEGQEHRERGVAREVCGALICPSHGHHLGALINVDCPHITHLFTVGRLASLPAGSLLSAIAAVSAGAVLLWNPLQGLVTLTYVLTAFFIVDGILIIILAITHRRQLSGKWEWMMVNGVIDLILAAIIISGLPGTLAWALGLIVGIDMLFGGASLVAMALEARKAVVS